MSELRGYLKPLVRDIFTFARAMRFDPTFQQRQAMELVQRETYGHPDHERKQRIAIKSGQGPGKTAVSVIIGLWRCLQDTDSVTLITAPSMRQCREVWLMEAGRLISKADPQLQRVITVTASRVIICNRTRWGVWTMTAKKDTSAQGYHEKNLTVIVEEASGVDRPFLQQLKGTLSNDRALMLMIGNPNTRGSEFYDAFNKASRLYHLLTFNAEETALHRPDIVSPNRNRLIAEEYGRDSDVYRIRVLGEFPHTDPNCVMSPEDLAICSKNNMMVFAGMRTGIDQKLVRQIAIDLARFGGDETTIFRRQGNAVVESFCRAHVDPGAAIARAFKMQSEAGWRDADTTYVCDATGIGQGAMHRFYDAHKTIYEYNNGGKAGTHNYANLITESWFHLARLVKRHAVYIPDDTELHAQLSSRQYFINKDGKLILEEKKAYVKRGYNSPDRADGCVMVFFDGVVSDGLSVRMRPSLRRAGLSV